MSEKRKTIFEILIILFIIIGAIVIYKAFLESNDKNIISNIGENAIGEIIDKNEVDETMENVININVSINGEEYSATFENNESAKSFINQLPQEFNMEELTSYSYTKIGHIDNLPDLGNDNVSVIFEK